MISLLQVLLFSLLISTSSFAEDKFVTPEWKNLLHYQRGVFGITSDVDDPAFFISPEGKSNPYLEHAASVQKVLSQDLEFVCKYPARFKYLNKSLNLNIDQSILKKCDKYQIYLADHYPKTVNLVFSSYYLESPASAFGHTFLRFSKNESLGDDKQSELLDVGINYGASNTSTNPLIYTVYGIIGGFQGTFSSIPYFYKIREYNDFESRDLWSYELNFTEAQKEKLLDHLWELGGTWYYYYFFTGNCSQKILSLLDGIEPSWKLLDKLPIYIIPAETIKVLHNIPGMVNKISFRPSKRRVFQDTYKQLSSDEQKIFTKIVEKDDWGDFDNSNLGPQAKAKILDVVIEFTDYKYSKEILFETGAKYEWKNKVLGRRAMLNNAGVDLRIKAPINEEPHISHPTRKIKLLLTKTEFQEDLSVKLSHRFALHDFTDPIPGNPKLSAINFGRVDFEVNKKSFKLDSFTPVEVATLNPWGSYFYPLSIYGIIDYSKDKTNLCSGCRIGKGTVASGPSWSFFNDRLVPFVMISSDFMFATSFDKNFDVNPGIMAGTVIRVYDFFSTFIRYKKAYAVFNKKENYITELTAQFHHTKYIDTSIEASTSDLKKQLSVGFNFFY